MRANLSKKRAIKSYRYLSTCVSVLFTINHILGGTDGTGKKENSLTIPFFPPSNIKIMYYNQAIVLNKREMIFNWFFFAIWPKKKCRHQRNNIEISVFIKSKQKNTRTHACTHVQNKEKEDKEYCLWCAECDIL